MLCFIHNRETYRCKLYFSTEHAIQLARRYVRRYPQMRAFVPNWNPILDPLNPKSGKDFRIEIERRRNELEIA